MKNITLIVFSLLIASCNPKGYEIEWGRTIDDKNLNSIFAFKINVPVASLQDSAFKEKFIANVRRDARKEMEGIWRSNKKVVFCYYINKPPYEFIRVRTFNEALTNAIDYKPGFVFVKDPYGAEKFEYFESWFY
jgi:hypothetical protein